MILWAFAIVLSVVLLVLTASMRASGNHLVYAHMLIAAAIGLAFVLMYVKERAALSNVVASASRQSALAARYLGLVWAWSALALAATYATGVLQWREWPYFLAASVIVAGLCLVYAAMLAMDAEGGRDDPTILRIGRILGVVQLVGMLVVVVGLVVDGKMARGLMGSHADWAANHVFFFGAIAIAAICALSLRNRAG